VHLPTRFAELLFGITSVGITVVIADDASAPAQVAHPGFLAPVGAKGAAQNLPRLSEGDTWRWQPDSATEGPITVVVSAADRRLVVLRNGIEIARRSRSSRPRSPSGPRRSCWRPIPRPPRRPTVPAGRAGSASRFRARVSAPVRRWT
jgi:hypothetical protein